ncbi:MAG: hypothetical protein M3P98_03150 [bacterium]|nr:hypothetical protein [bacterium]
MKLFLALFMTLATANVFAQGTYNALGAIKNQSKQYGAFVNSAAGAITRGMAVCLDRVTDDGIGVELCATEGAKPVGIVTEVSCAVGARCLLQTKGYFAFGKFDYAATATVAGGMIYADVDGDLTAPASVTTAMSPIGIAFDAVAADSVVLEIFIDL